MSTTRSNGTSDAFQQDRERLSGALRRQAEQIENLARDLKILQNEQQQLEEVAARLINPLEQNAADSKKAKALATSESMSHEAGSAETAAAVAKEGPGPAETIEPAGQIQANVPTLAQLSEEEKQKIHRDAQRFSKLLVTEIELYNKSGVEEGRRKKDLYLRLKKDIDRSRETYERRFADTVANQVDYFHEELVRRLAENDPALLGSGYPGPSV